MDGPRAGDLLMLKKLRVVIQDGQGYVEFGIVDKNEKPIRDEAYVVMLLGHTKVNALEKFPAKEVLNAMGWFALSEQDGVFIDKLDEFVKELAQTIGEEIGEAAFNATNESYRKLREELISILPADKATVKDYEESIESHLVHVHDLDVAMHGDGAATRPLLIDIKPALMERIRAHDGLLDLAAEACYERSRKNVSGRPPWNKLRESDEYDQGMKKYAYAEALELATKGR